MSNDNITFFQCKDIFEEYAYMQQPNKHPYEDDECRHDKRFEYKGVLTCRDCAYIYDERTCSWIQGDR